jgi:hypothetical protein
MTDAPIDLDGRRTASGKREIEMRRRPANTVSTPEAVDRRNNESLDAQLLAGPAQTWIEAMEKWRFLLDRYASSPDARDARIQKLIKHALDDMAHLKKREELT